jgi:hypothetical protein
MLNNLITRRRRQTPREARPPQPMPRIRWY